jgi:hypothetical protein
MAPSTATDATLFNPFAPWTDISLRAMDIMMASSQQWMLQAWQPWLSYWGAFVPMGTVGEGGPGSALQAWWMPASR